MDNNVINHMIVWFVGELVFWQVGDVCCLGFEQLINQLSTIKKE